VLGGTAAAVGALGCGGALGLAGACAVHSDGGRPDDAPRCAAQRARGGGALAGDAGSVEGAGALGGVLGGTAATVGALGGGSAFGLAEQDRRPVRRACPVLCCGASRPCPCVSVLRCTATCGTVSRASPG
jgi:hypothetical protein